MQKRGFGICVVDINERNAIPETGLRRMLVLEVLMEIARSCMIVVY